MISFRKRVRIVKGVYLNFGKTGLNSISMGPRGITLSIGRQGVYISGSLVGTGLSAKKWLYKAKKTKALTTKESGNE
ncbi:DUF4236 domain-containing protein [Vibrio marisflavi]|uniref:DUF4236 domain-containing protein n=1 Tax=Vibrio marisflavi CECT 7928 TaxID=634439 RepID=A0ABM9AA09_9VIBR|nr:DUF4236 domain-containing protein [Vibrio marisflavi]CAH0542987.1 hypothetical protein VMF7928_04347 [Vibrio marisflavi CECT 7928]